MIEYHKIQSVFKRDPDNKFKTFLMGQYTLPEFEYLAENQWTFTEKVDGTNIRVMFDNGEVSFGGKTDRAQLPVVLFEVLGTMFDKSHLKDIFTDGGPVCLYGEGYGDKIQKGSKYRMDQSFVLFDVLIGDLWLQREDVIDIGDRLGVAVVPVLGSGTLFDAVDMCRAGFPSAWGDFEAEGIVARPETELRARRGDRMITKIKCRDFPKGAEV